MIAYDATKLVDDLKAWMGQRFQPPILTVEGGWEYWMQIDFPAWLDVSRKQQFDVRREISLPTMRRLDWVFNSTLSGLQPWAVELKAQTSKYPSAQFVTNALADVAKLATLDAAKYPKRLSIAVTCDDNSYGELVKPANGYVEKFRLADNSAAFLFRYL